MITQSGYEDEHDDATRSETSTTHDSEATLPATQPESSSEQLQIAINEHESARASGHKEEGDGSDDDKEEEDEFAEEDAWLVAGHFFDDTERERDPEKYVPQLMDARAMRQLRSRLRQSEQQIETCGKMREFAPRKPEISPRSHSCRHSSSHRAHPNGIDDSINNNNNNNSRCTDATGNQQPQPTQQHKNNGSLLTSGPTCAFLTAAPSTAALQTPSASQKKQDFAVVLRRELWQLRELEVPYEEVKLMPLEQMNVICSVKPSERTGGPETYEKLTELMAFVWLCQAPVVQDS